MPVQTLGIIMHGVTGRMGMNQHLIRSIVAIRNQGGVTLSNGDKVMPDPILIGRNAEKMEKLAKLNSIAMPMQVGKNGEAIPSLWALASLLQPPYFIVFMQIF